MLAYQILYVDDDIDSCELMRVMIGHLSESCVLTPASSVEVATSLIDERKFDLYILDYALPEMTGVEFCRQIRERDSHTPILFYTAMGRGIDREQAFSSGANEYLVKPNDLDKLMETVERLLNERSRDYDHERSGKDKFFGGIY